MEGKEEGTGRGPQFEKNDPHHQMVITGLRWQTAQHTTV